MPQEESGELRALQSHIAAAQTRFGQRLQLQERSAAAVAARRDSIALDRALHQQRADVRLLLVLPPQTPQSLLACNECRFPLPI